MKNVLLTTTVLVAFAGAASAASHTGISWGGAADMQFNSLAGFTYGAEVDVTGTADLNNGITATMSYGIDLGAGPAITGDTYPVITLESAYGKLSGGDADAIGAASDHFDDNGATELPVTAYADTEFAIRADVMYSGVDVSVSEIVAGGASNLQVGASTSVSGFDLGLGYDSEAGGIGVSVDTSMSGFDIGVGYNTFDSSYGIEVAYAISSAISVDAAYDSTGAWDVGADYESGAITADVGYTSAGDITANGTYDLGSGLVAGAGYDSTVGFYADARYDLGSDAEAYAAYSSGANATEIGPEEYNGGITVGVSLEF